MDALARVAAGGSALDPEVVATPCSARDASTTPWRCSPRASATSSR
jgi:hypothetical protein